MAREFNTPLQCLRLIYSVHEDIWVSCLCNGREGDVSSDSHLDFFALSLVYNEMALVDPVCNPVEPCANFFGLSLLDVSIDYSHG